MLSSILYGSSNIPCNIFDNLDRIYYPGDTVSGKIVLETTEPISVRSIIINLSGISQTWNINWCEPNCKKRLFERSLVAWVSQDGSNQLPPGNYEFPFSTVIPKDCPPSYSGSNGENKYQVEVVYDIPWKINFKVVNEITVLKKLKLAEKYWMEPVVKTQMIKSGMIFNDGPITVTTTLPKAVYLAGDPLSLRLDINNTSTAHISRISIHFFSSTHYHSRQQPAPCKNHNDCPMSPFCRKHVCKRLGKVSEFEFQVQPHSEESSVFDYYVPREATTPSFESGLMTLRYFVCVHVWMKNGGPIWCATAKVYIGERKKSKEKKASGGDAPPEYTP